MTPREVFELYKEDVFRTCYYMLQNQQDAEDVCQDVFIKAFERDFLTIEKVKPWLLSIAMNTCRNFLKRRSRQGIWDWTKKLMDPHSSEKKLINEETRSELFQILGELPEKIRSVVILRYFHDLSYEEIAEVLQIAVGTVKSRCFKGHQTLQRKSKMQKLAKEWGVL
ncbi:RNA polymerase sigma factor [Ammoniphilus resinae]|uniref:RNA polymerase sigma-70 factor (ECF subfamily) n=1 Tax=Ammoniphilus resinae TaxID=861532 RepID=A0ABS4GUV4_9BACL|nr:RNA polymerase sigma factor [Ammoniphilus resinae]MBP1934053.1 RNA polymerase sigma-70 factor (ECF subfamily) [Ammoniphilus resinae]